MEMCSILMGFFIPGQQTSQYSYVLKKTVQSYGNISIFCCIFEGSEAVPNPKINLSKISTNRSALENKHKDTHMALSITSCHQQQIKTFTVTQRQEKSAGQKNLGGSREPRCGRVQGERWHGSWVWGKTDDSQIAKMDLRLPIWRISSSLTDLLCLSVCQHPAVQAAIH